MDDAPRDFIVKQLRAIVGIELPITRLEGKRKLSQNRPSADINGVIDGLRSGTPMQRTVGDRMRAELEGAG